MDPAVVVLVALLVASAAWVAAVTAYYRRHPVTAYSRDEIVAGLRKLKRSPQYVGMVIVAILAAAFILDHLWFAAAAGGVVWAGLVVSYLRLRKRVFPDI